MRPVRRAVAMIGLLLAGCAGQTAAPASVSTTPVTVTTTATTTAPQAITTTIPSAIPTSAPTTTTPPPLPTSSPPVGQLLVIGDFGSGGSAEYAIADAMHSWAESHDVAAILTTGDNLYINSVDKAWSTPFGWAAEMRIPVWTTWGNHDNQRPNAEDAAFDSPPRWSEHLWGDVRVLSLDSTSISSADQQSWIESALSGILGPMIVAEHHPPYSCSFHGDSRTVQKDWVPIFQQAGVELVLSGHEHNYQRFEVGGVEYIVTGGGGAGLYPLTGCSFSHPERIAGESVHHFLAISQDSGGLRVQVISSDGSMLDTFDVKQVIGGLPAVGHRGTDYEQR
jgi:hypothetical protein